MRLCILNLTTRVLAETSHNFMNIFFGDNFHFVYSAIKVIFFILSGSTVIIIRYLDKRILFFKKSLVFACVFLLLLKLLHCALSFVYKIIPQKQTHTQAESAPIHCKIHRYKWNFEKKGKKKGKKYDKIMYPKNFCNTF